MNKHVKSIIQLSIMPIIFMVISANTGCLADKTCFSSIRPKIKQEYCDYLNIKEKKEYKDLYCLYNNYPQVPIYKLMAIDIFWENPYLADKDVNDYIDEKINTYYSSSIFSGINHKNQLSVKVYEEINKLKYENNKIRNKKILLSYLYAILFPIILACIIEFSIDFIKARFIKTKNKKIYVDKCEKFNIAKQGDNLNENKYKKDNINNSLH